MRNLTVTLAVLGYYGFVTRQLDLGWLYDNFVPLMSASVAFSWALSACLYAASFRRGTLLAKGGNTGGHAVQGCILGSMMWVAAHSGLCLRGCTTE